MPRTPQTLIDALAAASDRPVTVHGPRGAITEATTWPGLHRDSDALARKLVGAGFSPGDRLGLMAETDLGFLRLFLALQKAGLVPVPLPLPNAFGDRTAHAERISRMLDAAGARRTITLADIEALPETDDPLPRIGPEDIAFLQFSSGSTRFPKGVIIRQKALMANARSIAAGLGAHGGDVCVSWLPLYHDMGLVGCFLAPLVASMRLGLIPTREFVRNPLVWLRVLTDLGGTLSYSPAFGYELAARRVSDAMLADVDLSKWRVAGIGGDMIRPSVLESFASACAPAGFFAQSFVASYGLAEATLAVTMARPGGGLHADTLDLDALEQDGIIRRARSGRPRAFARCGFPLPGTELRVIDTTGTPVGPSRVGRIQVRSASLMSGYYHEPEETARVLTADGWLDTGDLGGLVDGELIVTGRAKDLIIVNGRNLWPQDLEWAAEAVAPLRPGDVAAIRDECDSGEQVVLLVQCRLPDTLARDRLSEAVAAAVMAQAGVLCRVVLVPPHGLPRTSSGKLARSQARRLLAEGVFG